MRNRRLYKIITWTMLVILSTLLMVLAPTLTAPEFILADDFSHFWASGKLFINQENPYQLDEILKTLRDAGVEPTSQTSLGFQTLNPPWALLIFSPFGLLNYGLARLAWLMINIILLIIVARQFWQRYQGSGHKNWMALLAVFTFGPTFSVLSKGQVTIWVVLGITALIVYTTGNINSWWAGAGLVLITLKPQLFYLLWPALGLWVIFQRRWKLVISGAIVWFTAILFLHMVNPQLWQQYFAAAQAYPYDQWATPTIGSYLRYFWLGLDKFWIQYLPACFGLTWSIFHFLRHRQHWIWHEHLPVLLFVSLLTSPYTWTYDQILIIPTVISAAFWLSRSVTPFVIAAWLGYLAINIADILLHTQLDEFWFLWLAPAYTLWYIAVKHWHQE